MSDAKPNCICGGAGPALTEFLKNIGPPEPARGHFTQARVEFLKGLRSIIDARIEEMTKTPDRGTSVPVE